MGWFIALWVGLAVPVDDVPQERPPADYTLEWESPPGCPTAEEIEAQVGALTEDRLDGEGTMVVRGMVHQDDAGPYRLELTTTVGEREAVRELEATECVDLGQAVALVVAVTLVPSLEEGPPPEPEPEPVEPQPPVVAGRVESPRRSAPTLQEPPAEPTRSRRGITPPRVLLRAGLGLDVGGAPAPTLASRLAIGAVWTHVRVAIEGTHLVPQRADGLGSADGLVQQGTVGCSPASSASTSPFVCAAAAPCASSVPSPAPTKLPQPSTPLARHLDPHLPDNSRCLSPEHHSTRLHALAPRERLGPRTRIGPPPRPLWPPQPPICPSPRPLLPFSLAIAPALGSGAHNPRFQRPAFPAATNALLGIHSCFRQINRQRES